MKAFSSCGKWGLLSSCGAGASHSSGFSCCGAWALEPFGFSSWDRWAYLLHGMCNLPRPGTEPASPALAGRFLTTGPPGKSLCSDFLSTIFSSRSFYLAPFLFYQILNASF